MKTTPSRQLKAYHDGLLDITGAGNVDIQCRDDGRVLWVHVDGATVLRICRET